MNRRELITGIGRALCAGAAVPFLPSLLPEKPLTPWATLHQQAFDALVAGNQSGKSYLMIENLGKNTAYIGGNQGEFPLEPGGRMELGG